MYKLMKICISTVAMFFIATVFNSCGKDGGSEEDGFGEFNTHISLVGKPISIGDSIPAVIGSVAAIEGGYLFYTYVSDYLLLISDDEFNNFRQIIKKGNGPNELSQVSGTFGQELDDKSLLSVFDPNAIALYGFNPETPDSVSLYYEFPDNFRKYIPREVIKIKDGCYVAPREDRVYGMISFDSKTGTIEEWPVGYDFKDSQNPKEDIISKRLVAYCLENGMVAETYGCFPRIILHNEQGGVIKVLTYDNYKERVDSQGMLAECFMDIQMTSNHIWILYGDPHMDNQSRIFIVDYEGNGVAELGISPAHQFAIDRKKRRVIAVNPNEEETGIMVYRIPDSIEI